MAGPATVLCLYRVQRSKEEEFRKLLKTHWKTLQRRGLVTNDPTRVWRGEEHDTGGPIWVEMFTWKDGDTPNRAHEIPEVMAIWEPMGGCCESRGGKPAMEFPHVAPVDLGIRG